MRYLTVSVLFMFSCFASHVSAQNSDLMVLKSQVRELADASIQGNTEIIAKYTMDELIDYMGGKAAYIEFLDETYLSMEENGTKIISMEIQDGIIIEPFKDEWHCLIPNKTIVQVDDVTMESESYLFGKSSDKKTWKFIESRELNTEWAEEIFPDFETSLEIPPSKPLKVVD